MPDTGQAMPGTDQMIKSALSDVRWDYRTVEGIAKDTGLEQSVVLKFLQDNSNLVSKSSIPDKNGRDLYSLRTKSSEKKDFLRNLMTFISKQPN